MVNQFSFVDECDSLRWLFALLILVVGLFVVEAYFIVYLVDILINATNLGL